MWKPARAALLSNYLLYKILEEAGLPPGVIQFVPGPAEDIVSPMLSNVNFAGLHFTGSTQVFQSLWKTIGNNIEKYNCYPRIVGETGGKNKIFLHSSADVEQAVFQTLRGAFEYQGQKCSATSRAYIPESLWNAFKDMFLREVSKIKMGHVQGRRQTLLS